MRLKIGITLDYMGMFTKNHISGCLMSYVGPLDFSETKKTSDSSPCSKAGLFSPAAAAQVLRFLGVGSTSCGLKDSPHLGPGSASPH